MYLLCICHRNNSVSVQQAHSVCTSSTVRIEDIKSIQQSAKQQRTNALDSPWRRRELEGVSCRSLFWGPWLVESLGQAASSASDWCWHGEHSGYCSVVSDFSVPRLHYFLITSGMEGQDTFNDPSYLSARGRGRWSQTDIKRRILNWAVKVLFLQDDRLNLFITSGAFYSNKPALVTFQPPHLISLILSIAPWIQ